MSPPTYSKYIHLDKKLKFEKKILIKDLCKYGLILTIQKSLIQKLAMIFKGIFSYKNVI
jgi:hypothetical protein